MIQVKEYKKETYECSMCKIKMIDYYCADPVSCPKCWYRKQMEQKEAEDGDIVLYQFEGRANTAIVVFGGDNAPNLVWWGTSGVQQIAFSPSHDESENPSENTWHRRWKFPPNILYYQERALEGKSVGC